MFRIQKSSKFNIFQWRFLSRSAANILQLKEQGYFQEILPNKSEPYLESILAKQEQQTVYCGFDPTADSLQLGNLVALMGLLRCQRAGHNVIALVGGATSRIGDPSGKHSDRVVLQQEKIHSNIDRLYYNLENIFTNHSLLLAELDKQHQSGNWNIMNNSEWFDKLEAIDFISGVGHHLRLRDMLGKESIKQRMQSGGGMNIKEFLYPLFQAYDWLHLFNKYGCRFQIGGNDQQGNMDTGMTVIQRSTGEDVFGLTVPLLTQKGRKVGKSDEKSKQQATGQLIWLSPSKTSSYTFFQYLYGTPDADIEQMLRMFTFLNPEQLAAVISQHNLKPEDRIAQKLLASEATKLIHGGIGLQIAEAASRIIFSSNPDSIPREDVELLLDNPELSPVIQLTTESSKGVPLSEVIMRSGLFETADLASAAILKGSVRINGDRITDSEFVVNYDILQNSPFIKIGKHNGWIISVKPRNQTSSFS